MSGKMATITFYFITNDYFSHRVNGFGQDMVYDSSHSPTMATGRKSVYKFPVEF